ncbi:uncharacterized protein [Antedon mediterranea]|uniref:uncharacterized protein isoform X1 n=1 Tax=Antedon mediterranea TaxID=105859 RepID=UPI003AF50F04
MDHIDQRFLTDLSEDYVGLKYRWLRMLLHGIIPIGCLEVSTTGLELFNELVELGKISKSDVTLLSEVAETTEQTSAKDRIVDYKRTIQCSETLGTSLTSYRKALFEALRNVGRDDLLKVIGFYKLKDHGFNNIWDVVFHLEKQELLEDTMEKINIFSNLLNKKTGSKLLAAASKTLAIRGATAPSPQADLDGRLASQSKSNPLLAAPSQDFQQEELRQREENNITKKSDVSGTSVYRYWPLIALSIVLLALVANIYPYKVDEIRLPLFEQVTTPSPQPHSDGIEPVAQPVTEPTTKPVGATTEPTKFILPLTPTAPSRDWSAEGLRRMRENDLKKNMRGTVKVYDREFKFEGGHDVLSYPWYYSTATDIATGTKAEATGHQSMGGANAHAIDNLIYKLMEQNSIKN